MSRFNFALLILLLSTAAWAQTPAADATRAEIRKTIEHTAADPSQRSIIATPSIDFSAELAKDKKTATVKAGLALGEAFTLEGGFTGAFSEDDDRSTLASVRGLDTGSKGWGGLTYKKYRLRPDLAQLQLICWEYLWSTGQGLFDKDGGCQETTLPTDSFAERLANASPRTSVRAVCQRFNRVVSPTPTESPAIDCDANNVQTLLSAAITQFGERGAVSYQTQAGRTGANLVEICDTYLRSLGKPPAGKPCKPEDLPDKSWRELFDAAVQASSIDQVRVDICNEYRAARGLAPEHSGDCASTAGADALFTQSFRDRYAAAYHWGITPVVSGRYELNRSKFSYLDDTLTLQEPIHNSGAFLADVGVLTSGGTLATVGYRSSDVWTAKKSVTVCRPITGTDGAKCVPAIVGAPGEEKKHAIEAQAKRFFTKNIAAQIVATIDQDNHWQVDVPCYFIPDKDSKGLTGGVVASYKSEEKRWDVSVFVGQRFTLFN
jgi:hypothetical protein